MNAVIRKEAMRIAGEKVSGANVIDVRYPYDNTVVGTVPKATLADVRRAFEKAAGYNAKLSRADRSAILRKAADAAGRAPRGDRRADHAGVRPVPQGLDLRGRPRL